MAEAQRDAVDRLRERLERERAHSERNASVAKKGATGPPSVV
jgi:hypothetical protein